MHIRQSFFLFVHKALHLTGHGRPVWPIQVIYCVCVCANVCVHVCIITAKSKILGPIFIQLISNFRHFQLVDTRRQLLISWYSLWVKGETITVSLLTHSTRVFSRGLFSVKQLETHKNSRTYQHFSWNLQFSGATELCQKVYCRRLPYVGIFCAVVNALFWLRCLYVCPPPWRCGQHVCLKRRCHFTKSSWPAVQTFDWHYRSKIWVSFRYLNTNSN